MSAEVTPYFEYTLKEGRSFSDPNLWPGALLKGRTKSIPDTPENKKKNERAQSDGQLEYKRVPPLPLEEDESLTVDDLEKQAQAAEAQAAAFREAAEKKAAKLAAEKAAADAAEKEAEDAFNALQDPTKAAVKKTAAAKKD